MRRHLWIALALALVSVVAGCTGPNSPSPLPPPPPPSPPVVGVELAGTVSDAAWRPLTGARVEVVAGEGAGLSAIVDSRGNFRLRGPFDDTTQVRAIANGHVDVTQAFPAFCAPCNPNHWLHFYLESTTPHADLAGNYLMTFVAASGACPGLPDEARERTYAATLTRSSFAGSPGNSQFTITVSGATVLNQLSDGGSMGIVGDFVSLTVGGDWGQVVEEVAAHTYVAYEGSGEGSVGPSTNEIVLPFNGFIEHCALSAPMPGPYYACTAPLKVAQTRCASPNHRLVLRRMD